MAAGNLLIENYLPYVKDNKGINTKLPVALTGTAATLAVGGTLTVTGASTFTGGQSQSGTNQSTVWHSGGIGQAATTGAFQLKLVTTESYVTEVFIPDNTTVTGISVLNGHTTSASGNLFVGLANSAGTIVANSNTTTAQGTADIYQQIPFTTPYSAIGPGKYFIVVQGSQTTGFITSATIGSFGQKKVTSETYGTFLTTASYATTTFTTNVGVLADTY